MMKKDKLNIVFILIFIVGLSVMLYPFVSNYWNSRTQSKAVASYNEAVQSMTEEDYGRLFEEAEEYNNALRDLDSPYLNFDQLEGYEDILDITGTGIMGYVTIEKIDVELPIYHGTSEGVLQVAAGHVEGSSLPIGGIGTHSVLSAHRGLPSAKLFTNLDDLEEGDTFKVTVLNRTMTYQVDQIRIVIPQQIEELRVDPDKDYCTLLTCTPYGINTHRLLVRGVRISETEENRYVSADAYLVNPSIAALVIAIIILFAALLILLILQRLSWKKK